MKHISLFIVAVMLFVLAFIGLVDVFKPVGQVSAMRSQSVESRLKNFHALLDEQWEYVLRTNPELASILGDKRFNDRLSEFSQAAIDRDIQQTRVFLEKFESVDPTGFLEQEKLNR